MKFIAKSNMWKRFTAWQCVCVCRKWPFVLPRFACRAVCHQTALCCGYSANHQHAQWLGGLSQTGCIWRIKSKRHTHTHKHTLENWFLLKIFGKAEGLLCVSVLYMCLTLHVNPVHSEYTLSFYPHFQKHWWGLTGSAGKQIQHSINQPNVWINKRVVGD